MHQQNKCGSAKEHGSAEPTSSSHEPFQSLHEESPLNEFEEMEELWVGAFPTIFLFGRAHGNHSLLNPRQMEHLLLQFTNAAATNRELLFFLFDAKS